MNVQHKLEYTFTVASRELKLIRRALELEGGNGPQLARTITEQVRRSTSELLIHLNSLHNEDKQTGQEN